MNSYKPTYYWQITFIEGHSQKVFKSRISLLVSAIIEAQARGAYDYNIIRVERVSEEVN